MLSERLARIDALRVCTERAAKRETRLFGFGLASIAAAQHRAACENGNLGGIVGVEVGKGAAPSKSVRVSQHKTIGAAC